MGGGGKTHYKQKRKIRMTADVLPETTQVRRLWSKSLKHSKKKHQLGIPSLMKISPKIKSEINAFSYRQKVKEFNTSRRAPQRMLNSPLVGRKRISEGNMDLHKQMMNMINGGYVGK